MAAVTPRLVTRAGVVLTLLLASHARVSAQDHDRTRFMVVAGPGIAHAIDRGFSAIPVVSGRLLYRFDDQHAALLEGSAGWRSEVRPAGCVTDECNAFFGDRHRLGMWFVGLESDIVAPRIAGRRIDSRLVAGIGQTELLTPKRPNTSDRRGESEFAIAVGAVFETPLSRRFVVRLDTQLLLSRATAHLAWVDAATEIVQIRLGAGYGF